MMRALLVTAAVSLPTLIHAQNVLGRSMVEGRGIVIFADGTWDYDDTGTTECALISRGVEFCGQASRWQPIPPQTPEITASYRFDDRHYGQMIIEGLGEEDGLTFKAMRQIVIQNAASVTGMSVADIPVLDVFPSEVSGQKIQTIVYLVDFEGMDVVFANGVSTSPRETMQLMTYAIGAEFTDQHRELHEEFLSNIKVQD
ncbi:hypothetical protein [Roseobacter sp. CCS2]|uniref:hypothetical protein n=1 Tax=Roseobacter sp. CCS2 TaxID=391593 RepID=UPI0000F3E5E2|nr:hypothetical protein [Roseobacter sp. CCS2]EBA10966.1 hypothetical protein RCCS2_00754 [Roseobacter sp. CCS2]